MKTKFNPLLFLLFLLTWFANAQQLTQSSFDAIDLNYPGLEKVKTLVSSKNYETAATELLRYFRERKI